MSTYNEFFAFAGGVRGEVRSVGPARADFIDPLAVTPPCR